MKAKDAVVKSQRAIFNLAILERGGLRVLSDERSMSRSDDGLTYTLRSGHDLYTLDLRDFGVLDGADPRP